MNKKGRCIILMLDSFGIGGAKDANKFGDEGANTLYHIAEACAKNLADSDDKNTKRQGRLNVRNLARLGLGMACEKSSGLFPDNLEINIPIIGKYGYATEISKGKDTSSGHWELAGAPVDFDWGYFKPDFPSFPEDLIKKICSEAKLDGILGNKAASGTQIIEELGEEHIKTGMPICYTSADSVFQIACHEEYFGLDRLYKLCEIVFKHLEQYNIARVIARPFTGKDSKSFVRTKNRHDYSVKPHRETILDIHKNSGGNVISIGKISDIYAGCGITKAIKASGLKELTDKTIEAIKNEPDNSIIFTNFVDFDMLWGHRRNVAGYAWGLEYFDKRLEEIKANLRDDDIVFITADHGCDPTHEGTDHTRENVPILLFGKKIEAGYIGERSTFADIGQTIATFFNHKKLEHGTSIL
jgi:phosphopentomutase